MISSLKHPKNHPIYSMEIDLGFAIVCNSTSDEQHDCEFLDLCRKVEHHLLISSLLWVQT